MSTYAYDQLVRAFREARQRIENAQQPADPRHEGVDVVAEAVVEILADDDPRFDAEAFRKAVEA
jgi:hypothetical protein